jgi:uncharacterized protein (DUF433 family)
MTSQKKEGIAMLKNPTRIVHDPKMMGGKPYIRGSHITVRTIVDLVAAGSSTDDIIKDHPDLEAEDVREALWSAGVSEIKAPREL